jgi:hypothetical protein
MKKAQSKAYILQHQVSFFAALAGSGGGLTMLS